MSAGTDLSPVSWPDWINAGSAAASLIVAVMVAVLSYRQGKTLGVVEQLVHRRDYALKGFDDHVGENVSAALSGIDELLIVLGRCCDTTASANQRTAIDDLLNCVLPCSLKIRQLGREADLYLQALGHSSRFEALLQWPEKDVALEDVFAVAAQFALNALGQQAGSPIFSMIFSSAADKVIQHKASLRAELVTVGRQVAQAEIAELNR